MPHGTSREQWAVAVLPGRRSERRGQAGDMCLEVWCQAETWGMLLIYVIRLEQQATLKGCIWAANCVVIFFCFDCFCFGRLRECLFFYSLCGCLFEE